jgi:2-polyprenyl-3-methyl-5-hydroxy-6-metoxy-1,4-benzoquinol methylase
MRNPIQWEAADCVICDDHDAVPSDIIRWRHTDLRYVVCSGCGLKFMRPRPTKRWYATFYRKEFWNDKVATGGFTLGKASPILSNEHGIAQRIGKQQWRSKRILSRISPLSLLSSNTVVLEVGASWGETLSLLNQSHHCRVLGVEPSDLARTYADQNHHIQWVGRNIEDLAGPQSFDGRVDLVILSHVLENTTNPLESLQIVRKLLSPIGRLYVDTPNFYYHWNAPNPYHPYIFRPATLKALLAKAGFTALKIFCEDHPRRVNGKPTDMYLSVIARSGPVIRPTLRVDIPQLLADQKLGFQLLRETEKPFN